MTTENQVNWEVAKAEFIASEYNVPKKFMRDKYELSEAYLGSGGFALKTKGWEEEQGRFRQIQAEKIKENAEKEFAIDRSKLLQGKKLGYDLFLSMINLTAEFYNQIQKLQEQMSHESDPSKRELLQKEIKDYIGMTKNLREQVNALKIELGEPINVERREGEQQPVAIILSDLKKAQSGKFNINDMNFDDSSGQLQDNSEKGRASTL